MSYDNTCKYLAEHYPSEFANWLLSIDTSDIQVLKTELNLEPIRADSVTFLQIANQILHLEFQTSPQSTPPLDFRMLDYYTRLKRQLPAGEVTGNGQQATVQRFVRLFSLPTNGFESPTYRWQVLVRCSATPQTVPVPYSLFPVNTGVKLSKC